MSPRKYGRARCGGCGLHEPLCICAELPRVDVETGVVVVQQIRERFKPTNTGKLVPQVLRNAWLVHYGFRDRAFDTSRLDDPETDYWILFPSEDAIDLDEVPAPTPGRRRTFVVLDGTWHQCSRMRRRVPRVCELSPVRLPTGAPSIWPARTQHHPRGVSTFEAVTRLVGALHGAQVAAPLEEVFRRIVSRLVYMRGKSREYE